MSEQTLFIVGAIIFAITVYGSVMAGGLALARLEAADDVQSGSRTDDATPEPIVSAGPERTLPAGRD